MEAIYFNKTDPAFIVLYELMREAREVYEELPKHGVDPRVQPPLEFTEHKEQARDLRDQVDRVLYRISEWRTGRARARELVRVRRQLRRYVISVLAPLTPLRHQFVKFLERHQDFLAALTALKTMFGEIGN